MKNRVPLFLAIGLFTVSAIVVPVSATIDYAQKLIKFMDWKEAKCHEWHEAIFGDKIKGKELKALHKAQWNVFAQNNIKELSEVQSFEKQRSAWFKEKFQQAIQLYSKQYQDWKRWSQEHTKRMMALGIQQENELEQYKKLVSLSDAPSDGKDSAEDMGDDEELEAVFIDFDPHDNDEEFDEDEE